MHGGKSKEPKKDTWQKSHTYEQIFGDMGTSGTKKSQSINPRH